MTALNLCMRAKRLEPLATLINNTKTMKQPKKLYKIAMTACWPCCWKCEIQKPYVPDNASHLYHRTEEEALEWIIAHNGDLI